MKTLDRFAKINKQIDKDCPLYDCKMYNSELRGGCFIGSKRKNCRWYDKKTEEQYFVWDEKTNNFKIKTRSI